MSDSVRPHTQKPTRLPRPWDSPGKNTGVGCHFLLQCMKVKSESEVAQLCLTLSNPMDCSPPGSSIHGIFQARVLKCAAIAFSNSCLFKIVILYHTMVFLFSNYFGIFILFFIVATPDYILANSVQGFSFLRTLTSIYFSFFFFFFLNNRHLTRC